MIKYPTLLFILGICIAPGLTYALADRPSQPNIILILTDDLGWQDVKCYDIDTPSPMETPNLDRLATRGVQFWQAYSPAPTCAPSRAAILSGHHPARAQMTHVSGGRPPHPHHPTAWTMMSPWYSARMPSSTVTLPEVLKERGYATGHSGKWHIAKNHHGFPQPGDQGFDFTRHSRGVQVTMKPDRLSDFATDSPSDPFRLDANGFPFDQTHHDAMTFVKDNRDKPFFLYYATWLVHTPIVMRSESLLRKYEKKLGIQITDKHRQGWQTKGQTNPFYCAMVEQLDYNIGQLITYLEATEDPRWAGHPLIENTYIIFTSDNGGMEGSRNEIITDNAPLDKGKISLMEGGTRVPLLISGPNIPTGIESDVMVNGLDFFPTILTLANATPPRGKQLDGLDLVPLLTTNPKDPTVVKLKDGSVRDSMIWHFPNSAAQESSIRIGDFKLVRNYMHQPALELYRLYDSRSSKTTRSDIEEKKNLVSSMPDKAARMNARLTQILTEMNASYPYYNPLCPRLPKRKMTATVLSHSQREVAQQGNADQTISVEFKFQENGAKVIQANLMYTPNGGDRFEEWFRLPAILGPNSTAVAKLPKGTTHFLINLIDENRFLISYPEIDALKIKKLKIPYSKLAIPTRGFSLVPSRKSPGQSKD